MFYDSLAFQAMRSSLNGLAIEQNIILHNLANYETPDYKAKSVKFEDVLKESSRKDGSGGMILKRPFLSRRIRRCVPMETTSIQMSRA